MFEGYAGGAPVKIEDEMKRKAWLLPARLPDLVLVYDPVQLWQKTSAKKVGNTLACPKAGRPKIVA